ncbi:MAG: hypothetical protein HUJ56_05060 [Erysipelotrichaceae bacterium]|mgnify:CR=1 FL=1|nr:hypothetical protein [Erysipelotrichaceae bacterium]
MIGKIAHAYCDRIEEIENYKLAIADETHIWECHHRLEENYTRKELIQMKLYYHVQPKDLIFLTRADHRKVEHKGFSSYRRRSLDSEYTYISRLGKDLKFLKTKECHSIKETYDTIKILNMDFNKSLKTLIRWLRKGPVTLASGDKIYVIYKSSTITA